MSGMTDAPERIWATPTETVNNRPSWIDEIEVSHPDSFGCFDETGTEYIRADLARLMTVAEAAKVLLDNTPNPIFDVLKYPMMGEFEQSIAVQDEDGEEVWRDVTIEWTTIKEILAAALCALSEG